MISLMSSVPDEGKLFIKRLKKQPSAGGRAVYRGRLNGTDVLYMISGIGKTNAAHAATVLIERYSPELVILFGVGGAYPSSGLKVGDIAVAEEEIYGDEGVMDREGFHGIELIGIPLLKKGSKRYFNRFSLDRKLVKESVESSGLLAHYPSRVPFVKSGVFVTVSTCTGTRKRALQITRRFGAICENMEGASVAHVCAIYAKPMIEIRGISNIVEDRDPKKWNIKLAADNCQKVVMEVLKAATYP